jgi:hypothetical protein
MNLHPPLQGEGAARSAAGGEVQFTAPPSPAAKNPPPAGEGEENHGTGNSGFWPSGSCMSNAVSSAAVAA